MATKIRVWLDDDRVRMHHADASQIDGMESGAVDGVTDCGREGLLRLVHHENVDMGALCKECLAISGTRPALDGDNYGPV